MGYNSTEKIQVVLASKHFLYRLGLKTIISVIGVDPDVIEVNSYEDLCLQLHGNELPDFIIANQDILPEDKCEVVNTINRFCPECKLMIAIDEVNKDGQPSRYCANLENQKQVLETFQDFFFEPVIPEELEETKSNLSHRELDVLKNVALGLANKEIANKLFISTNTVITHRKNITEKLGIKTIAGLTAYAIMNNLITADEVNH